VFDFRPSRYHITTLGKLFTHIHVPVIKWPQSDDSRAVTADLFDI